jgi:4-hydroxyacetophenone monooxygenase
MEKVQEWDPEWQASGGLVSEANDNLRAGLTDYIKASLTARPELVAKVTPGHVPMARRLIVDNGWYETLSRDNVELVTDPIEEVCPGGIRTRAGDERPAELILAAIGFSTTKYLHPTMYIGIDGRSLEEHWTDLEAPRAYLGMCVPAFPNMFIMYGPGAQPRSGALIPLIEAWAAYAAQLVVAMIEGNFRRISVKESVFADYNRRFDDYSRRLVWLDPGSAERNYYVTASGQSFVNEPWPVEQFYQWLRTPNLDDFVVE